MLAAAKQATVNVILEITNRVLPITRTLLWYRLLQYLSFPLIVIYFGKRLVSQRDYWAHFGERFGFLPQLFRRTSAGSIWFHAVSVGEVASAVPLLRALREHSPHAPVFLSTSTVSGRHMASRVAVPWVNGIFYAPVDYAWCIRRVLRWLRPTVLVVLETEIWPNLFAETKNTGAQLVLANARISDKAWPRYRRWQWLFRSVLQLADVIYVQSDVDAERYRFLGADASRVRTAGNLKYDAVPEPSVRLPLSLGSARHVWIAASTVGPNERGSIKKHAVDEDDLVLDAFAAVCTQVDDLLLILAPRQPNRFETVAQKLRSRGIPFVRRTDMQGNDGCEPPVPGVLLLDTVGELLRCYAHADVVFVGGSLAPRGGHNILEPAAAGAPIVVGPHMHNFQAIAADFLAASALVEVKNGTELGEVIRQLLSNKDRAHELGKRARQLVARRQGTANLLAADIAWRRPRAFLREPRGRAGTFLLHPFAHVWKHGGFEKRRRGEESARTRPSLPVPVISIGGITLGGSGKTPFCNYVASELRARHFSPAILTRGYRRQSPAQVIVIPPGAVVPAYLTGDEAQIFLRAAQATLGIGANRYEVAQTLLQQAPETDVFLLDDGFQHAPLSRDLDVVLIDGLDPFGGGEVVPLGRLREPLTALTRAHIFVVTRAPERARFEAIRDELHRWNPQAPVFSARLEPHRWRRMPDGEFINLPLGTPVGAFCGLGNPANFWRTLELLHLKVESQWTFGDHHLYKPMELKRLAHLARARGIEVLVTTEKDSINLPGDLESLLNGVQLAWLPIELRLEDSEPFFAQIEKVISRRLVLPRTPSD